MPYLRTLALKPSPTSALSSVFLIPPFKSPIWKSLFPHNATPNVSRRNNLLIYGMSNPEISSAGYVGIQAPIPILLANNKSALLSRTVCPISWWTIVMSPVHSSVEYIASSLLLLFFLPTYFLFLRHKLTSTRNTSIEWGILWILHTAWLVINSCLRLQVLLYPFARSIGRWA